MAVLLDTSFLLAASWRADTNHVLARETMAALWGGRIVAAPLLTELFYMLSARANYQSAVRVFTTVQTVAFQIEPLTAADMLRMTAIMHQYADNRFDYVDTALMALSERLNITEIYTFDRRDFSAFRPAHIVALRLIP